MQESDNMQENLLNYLHHTNMSATFFLINGYQLKGKIRAFDDFALFVEAEGKLQMIYKHAISTIMPSRAFRLADFEFSEEED